MALFSGRVALACRSLFRQRARTMATLASIMIGVTSLILAGGFVADIIFQLGEATIHSQTGHVQLAAKGYWESRTRAPQGLRIPDPSAVKKLLSELPEVDQAVARLNFIGSLNNGKRDLGIIGDGIEPDGEAKIGTFMRYVAGRPLTDTDTDGMVIGQGVAQSLALKVGDTVTLVISLSQGALNTAEFTIIGIFQSFSKDFDARAVRIPLRTTQDLLEDRSAHIVAITLHETKKSDLVATKVTQLKSIEGLDNRTWNQLSDFYEKTVELYGAQFGVLRLIIFLMVLLSVANSINMTLFERTREFGTMRALGDTPRSVFELIMAESFLLGVFGAAFGMVSGLVLAEVISLAGIPMPPPPNSNLGYTAQIRLEPSNVIWSGLTGFLATVVAAIFPAFKSSRIDIVEALRQGA